MVLGNLDGFVQWIERGSLTPMDYWRSSRVVARGDTINEFPFFSTIHGDLHPHFMVLPVTALLLGLLLDRRLFPRRDGTAAAPWLGLGAIAFVLGAMVCISTWELPVGALLVFLLLGRDLALWPPVTKDRLRVAAETAGVLVLAGLLFLPFYLHFSPPASGGIGVRMATTSLAEFLTVFGHLLFPLGLLALFEAPRLVNASAEGRHMLIAIAVLVIALAAAAGNAVIPLLLLLGAGLLALHHRVDDDESRAPVAIAVVALVALLACELVFVRDSYGEKLYRMNTVFKLYFQAWLLLAVAAPWGLAALIRRSWTWTPAPRLIAGLAGLAIAAAAAYPLGMIQTRLGSPWPLTIDGTAYLEREHPDDFAAIAWLREKVEGRPVLLEASGDPYSYYARFSSNTGLPTVMGWANHEGLWRGHDPAVETRKREVRQAYSAPTLDAAQGILDRYAVRFVLVGDLERQDFGNLPGALDKFAALPVAFRQGQTVIYER
jgi:YYY domain-containing protein